MDFVNAVSLLVVFSLVLIQTEAVLPNRENITANGNITFTRPSNVTGGESNNHTVIPQIRNTTKEIQNHTNTNTESPTEPILDKKIPSGQEDHGETFKNILQTLNLERGIEMQDLNVLLQKLGVDDCSRPSGHRVNNIIFLCVLLQLFCNTSSRYLSFESVNVIKFN